MASKLLGNLRVRLTAETADFKRGMDSAKKSVGGMSRDLKSFRTNSLANVASLGALGYALKSSLDVANRYENAQRQLASTAKLTGVELGFLKGTAAAAGEEFQLSKVAASGFTIELAKLATKAGQMDKAADGLRAFLDVGAARGLTAVQTLQAVKQSILGIDEGTDKLFNANPSVLYKEFADKVGLVATKMTDAQKAQAILDRAISDGAKVRGEYGRWLTTSQGQQHLLTQGIEETQAALGTALQPALVTVIPLISLMAKGVRMSVEGWQMLGAEMALIPPILRMIPAIITGNAVAMAGAVADFVRLKAAVARVVADIVSGNSVLNNMPPIVLPPIVTDTGDTGGNVETGKIIAKNVQAGIEAEFAAWREKFKPTMAGVTVQGSDLKAASGIVQVALQRETVEAKIRDRMEEQRSLVGDIAGSMNQLLSGGLSGGNIGSMVGGLLGTLVPGTSGLFSTLGSMFGGLFGGGERKDTPTFKALDAIERAQRETISAIKQSTKALIDPTNSFLNAPSDFSLPTYFPSLGRSGGSGGNVSNYGDTNVNMNMTFSGNHTAEEIKRLATLAVEEDIQDSMSRSTRKSHGVSAVGFGTV